MQELIEIGAFNKCEAHWVEYHKELHSVIRQKFRVLNEVLTPKEHSQLLYMHLLIGKIENIIDWKEERETRFAKPMEKKALVIIQDQKTWSQEEGDRIINASIKYNIN